MLRCRRTSCCVRAVPRGYRVIRADMQKTTPEAQGWVGARRSTDSKPVSCYQRPVAILPGEAGAMTTLQCLFGDGVATVSLFAEVFDPGVICARVSPIWRRHPQPVSTRPELVAYRHGRGSFGNFGGLCELHGTQPLTAVFFSVTSGVLQVLTATER